MPTNSGRNKELLLISRLINLLMGFGNAHIEIGNGFPSQSSGAAKVIITICCVICMKKSCPLSASTGESNIAATRKMPLR